MLSTSNNAILKTTHEASFRGVKFLYDSSREQAGRKSVVYEFPNRNQRTVSDLGELLKTYKIKGIVTGSGSDYIQNRNALVDALKASGSGILNHPFDGQVTVFAKPYTLNESISDIGYAEFDMTFVATTEPQFPTSQDKDAESGKTGIFENLSKINSSLQSAFQDIWNVEFEAQDYITQVSNAIDDVSRALQTASSIINVTLDQLTPLTDSIDELQDSANLLDPQTLSDNVTDAFDTLSASAENAQNQFEAMSSFNNFTTLTTVNPGKLIGLNQNNTVKRNASNTNVQLINQYVNMTAFNYNLLAVASIVFTNEESIQEARSVLTEQYEYILNNNFYLDLLGNRLAMFTNDAIDLIQDSYVLANEYLKNQASASHKLNEIYVQNQSLVSLVYSLYGNLDNLEIIQEINQIGDPTNVSGPILVVTE